MSYNPFEQDINEEKEFEQQEQQEKEFEVDIQIIRERNKDIQQLERDIRDLAEIQMDIGLLIQEQGEQIDLCSENIIVTEKNTEEAVANLEKCEEYNNKTNSLIRDVIIVSSSAGLGCLGFIGGPFIGLGTLILTTLTGSGVVLAIRQ